MFLFHGLKPFLIANYSSFRFWKIAFSPQELVERDKDEKMRIEFSHRADSWTGKKQVIINTLTRAK